MMNQTGDLREPIPYDELMALKIALHRRAQQAEGALVRLLRALHQEIGVTERVQAAMDFAENILGRGGDEALDNGGNDA